MVKNIFRKVKHKDICDSKYTDIFKKLGDTQIHVLVITDTHNSLGNDEFPHTDEPYDLLICLGDIGWLDWMELFSNEKYLKIPVKIGIAGNHDMGDFSKVNEWLRKNCASEIVNIHNTIFKMPDIDLKFAGIKSSVKYKNSKNLLTQKEAYDISESLPDVDILLTHSNLKEERNIKNNLSMDAHEGLYGIMNYMQKNNCFYNIHGHVHKNYVREYIMKHKKAFIEISLYRIKELYITKNGIEISN